MTKRRIAESTQMIILMSDYIDRTKEREYKLAQQLYSKAAEAQNRNMPGLYKLYCELGNSHLDVSRKLHDKGKRMTKS